jgi:hypothetical protein
MTRESEEDRRGCSLASVKIQDRWEIIDDFSTYVLAVEPRRVPTFVNKRDRRIFDQRVRFTNGRYRLSAENLVTCRQVSLKDSPPINT